MKLKFKQQAYQTHAVAAVADCFIGPPKSAGVSYRIDSGREDARGNQALPGVEDSGFKNGDLAIPLTVIVEHLAYDPVEDTHTLDIFTQEKSKEDFSKTVKTDRHIYD
jgi:hypothetical protein